MKRPTLKRTALILLLTTIVMLGGCGLWIVRLVYGGTLTAQTPLGPLTMRYEIPDDKPPLPEWSGQMRGPWFVANHPSLYWIGFALEADSAVVWPHGASIWVTTPSGEYRDSLVVGCEPIPGMRPFSVRGKRLDPARLWRDTRDGKVVTLLLVAFPRGAWTRSQVTALRLGPK